MYSQRDEETYILQAVGDYVGHFLDIGAYDGVHYSNTMALVERGWSGVMVEPALEAFQALLKNHGNNPRLTLVHAAVGTNPLWGFTQFWDNPESYSTTLKSNRDIFAGQGFYPPFLIPSVPLDEILHIAGKIDVLNIDTEGSSIELFRAFLALSVQSWPRLICVEHDGRTEECLALAERYGYTKLMEDPENYIFVKETNK